MSATPVGVTTYVYDPYAQPQQQQQQQVAADSYLMRGASMPRPYSVTTTVHQPYTVGQPVVVSTPFPPSSLDASRQELPAAHSRTYFAAAPSPPPMTPHMLEARPPVVVSAPAPVRAHADVSPAHPAYYDPSLVAGPTLSYHGPGEAHPYCGYGSFPRPGKQQPRAHPAAPACASRGVGGLDVCFVVDCTGSMAPWIDAAKNTVNQMIEALPPEEPNKRVSVIAYRDFSDGPAQVFDFSADTEAAKRFLGRQEAMGGDDGAEDVAGGLAAALACGWASETRTLVFIADAACHGKEWHEMDDFYDSFPEGDPTGLDLAKLLRTMRSSGIDLTFVQLTDDTEKMQRKFREVYEGAAGPENIHKFELRDLRGIIQAAGGISSMRAGDEGVYMMMQAAVTPTVQSSYATTQCQSQVYSANTETTYMSYQASMPTSSGRSMPPPVAARR